MAGSKGGTGTSNQKSVREALQGNGESTAKKGPAATDGVLTPNHDGPEVLEWRSKSGLDVAETSSTYLDEEDDIDGQSLCCL